ncbi:hypothetical protein HZ326_13243 [Fusarium oxysporum f. sp. albedinis]|nr:hypothetical protein HZ326_13243 [Fusarium oxysporum f. sp. albedinis]
MGTRRITKYPTIEPNILYKIADSHPAHIHYNHRNDGDAQICPRKILFRANNSHGLEAFMHNVINWL